MTGLPAGWVEAALGEVADTRLGKMLSAKARAGANPRPYLRNKNVQWGRIDLSDLLVMDFDDDEFERFRLAPGDVLVCEGGEVGRAAIWRDQIDNIGYQKALHRIRPARGVLAEYLLYAFRWFADMRAFESFITGSTINHLPQEDLRRLPIPLPPEAEQRRIVAAIEEHFPRLDAADASLHRAAAQLRVMVDAIHTSAVAGPWPTVPLDTLLRERLRNGHSAKASHDGTGVRTLTLSAVTNRDFSEKNTKLTTADPARVHQLWLEPGDILIERSNTPELVGTAALYRGERDWAIFPDLLIRVRVSNAVLPAFLEIVLRAKPARRYFQRSAEGIAGSMPKIDQRDVRRLPIPFPPLDAQSDIVAEVDRQLSIVDAMSHELERAVRRSSALRRGILEEAFSGKLVPQDPSDEPAAVLLERIAAERAASAKPSRRKSTIPA